MPRRPRRELPGFDVSTVPDEGWASRRNGDLLRLMLGAGFTVFVTMDRNLGYQQNVAAAGVSRSWCSVPGRIDSGTSSPSCRACRRRSSQSLRVRSGTWLANVALQLTGELRTRGSATTVVARPQLNFDVMPQRTLMEG